MKKQIKEKINKYPKIEALIRSPYSLIKAIKHNFMTVWIKIFGISNGKKRFRLLSVKNSNILIKRMIEQKQPFMIARYGGTEFSNLTKGGDDYFKKLAVLSGFFPEKKELFPKFKQVYEDSSKDLDVLAVWIYKSYFRRKSRLLKTAPNLKNIIPLDVLTPKKDDWFKALEGKRVLVVHPFKKSMLFQYKRRKNLGIIPNFKTLEIIPAVQTVAGEVDNRFKDWFQALEYMKKEIYKKRHTFDIALIGCGAYGFPLAAYTKKIGKQAIHVGGSLQLLFAIKGKRWEDAGKKFPENWIYPFPEDTPKKNKQVEGGCYWK